VFRARGGIGQYDTAPNRFSFRHLNSTSDFYSSLPIWSSNVSHYCSSLSCAVFQNENSLILHARLIARKHQAIQRNSLIGPRFFKQNIHQWDWLGNLSCISTISFIADTFAIIIQQYADDTQLYISLTTTDMHARQRANVLSVRRTRSRLGDRSFSVAGPRVWNSLPVPLWLLDVEFRQFKRLLKSFHFGEIVAHLWLFLFSMRRV